MEQKGFRWGFAIMIIILLSVISIIFAGALSLFVGVDVESLNGNVAVIPLHGVIVGTESSNELFSSLTTADDTIELIEKASSNPGIRAIIIDINSPGGSAVASEEIANALKKVNKTKVALIREVGASGAYWVASSADYIVASRASITGSIGVIASYLEFGGLLERYNVSYTRLVSGEYKDMGSPYRKLTLEEKKMFEQTLNEIRDYFVEEVSQNRGMSKKEVDKVANGLFYLGQQAKDFGLVDELGGKDEAIAYIQQAENIEVELVEYKTTKGLLEILEGVVGKQSYLVGRGLGSAIIEKTMSNYAIMT